MEEGELLDSDDDNLPIQNTFIHKLSSILLDISSVFPDLISVKSSSKCRDLGDKIISPKIILEVNLDNTWLMAPPPVNNDTIGSWPSNVALPSADKNLLPPKMSEYMPSKFPVIFKEENKNWESFFNADSLAHNGIIKLHDSAFEPCEIKADAKWKHFSIIDAILRKSLMENCIVDQFISCSLSHLGGISNKLTSNELSIADVKNHLDVTTQTLNVSWSANQRCSNFISAAFAANKFTFRQVVLDNCNGWDYSKSQLKGSTLASPYLFGDIPESFAKKLEINSNSYQKYILKPKFANYSRPNSYGVKRTARFSDSFNNKRFAPNMNAFSTKPTGGVDSYPSGSKDKNSRFFQRKNQQDYRKGGSGRKSGKR